jgi:hypothetical protein
MSTATILEAAAAHQAWEQQLAMDAAYRASRLWGAVDGGSIIASWAGVAPAAYVITSNAQREAAAGADPYLEQIAAAQDAVTIGEAAVAPEGFSGLASDGRGLQGLLMSAPYATLGAIAAGAALADALALGEATLQMMVATQIADAMRVATELSMFLHDPETPPADVFKGPKGRLMVRQSDGTTAPYFRPKGYVRQVQPGACPRCVILAGRRYSRAQAFLRHPNCHCIHIPVDEDVEGVPVTDPQAYFDSLSRAEQDRIFTKDGAEAIRQGADMNQVVNARRGMSYAGVSSDGTYRGQKATGFTTEGTTKRGYARSVMGGKRQRLVPEEIFRIAGGNREEAIRLLKANGYIR